MTWSTEQVLARTASGMENLMRRLESAEVLDQITTPLSGFVNRLVPPGSKARHLLRGAPVGHPVHPALVEVPLGAWMSAVLLDRLPGTERSAQVLVGIGTLAAAPAAATGIADWATGPEPRLRVGIIHWAANTIAVGCFAASFIQRVRGRTDTGKRLALIGISAASIGGYLGGHLAFRLAPTDEADIPSGGAAS